MHASFLGIAVFYGVLATGMTGQALAAQAQGPETEGMLVHESGLPPTQSQDQALAYICQSGAVSGYFMPGCVSTQWYCANVNPGYALCPWCSSINWNHPNCH